MSNEKEERPAIELIVHQGRRAIAGYNKVLEETRQTVYKVLMDLDENSSAN